MIKQKPVYCCDNCGKEMTSPVIQTEDVANEGCSTISSKDHTFDVDEGHYCGIDCLYQMIKKSLKI